MATETIGCTFGNATADLWDDLYGAESMPECNFYLKQFTTDPLKGKTLDIGCGTGRFLLPFLKTGHEAVGIDSSADMLSILQRKMAGAGLDCPLVQTTFEKYEAPGVFQGITAFYVVFYLLETKNLISFFRKAHDLLSSKGIFLINFYNIFELWNPKVWTSKYTYTFAGGFGLQEYIYTPLDYLRGVAEMQDYCMRYKNGVPTYDYNVRPVRFYSMTEIVLLLESTGFVDVAVHADLRGEPVGKEDVRGLTLYAIARKP